MVKWAKPGLLVMPAGPIVSVSTSTLRVIH